MDSPVAGDVLSDERGGYLELASGAVWPASVVEDGDVEDFDLDELESDRWLYVPGDGRDAWRDMASFADQVPDARSRDDLKVAVDGKGALRRFQAALDRDEANWVDWRVWSSEGRLGAPVSGWGRGLRTDPLSSRTPPLRDPGGAELLSHRVRSRPADQVARRHRDQDHRH